MWPADKLIERIREDFPILPTPDYEQIGGEATFYFTGKKWTEVNLQSYLEHGVNYKDWDSYLSWLDGEAFAYFLPSHMIMCLLEQPEKLRFLQQSLLMKLHSPDVRQENPHNFERGMYLRHHLTPNQKRDIALFLQHQLHHAGAQPFNVDEEDTFARTALDSYWHQFLPNKDGK